jgi:hypothetical protein
MHRDLRPPRTSIRWASIVATSAAFAALIAGGVARAASADAEALFNEGNQLMAEGKEAQACDAFEASNRAEPRAGTLIHLGVCRERNHQLASAWSAYKDALTRARDPVKRDVAAARAAALEPRLSYLTVSIPERSRLDGLTVTRNGAGFDRSLWNRPLPVDAGDYVIAGRAPDHEDWQITVHVQVEGDKRSVSIPRLKQLPATTGLTTERKVAIGVASVSVAGGAAGVVLGLLAWRDKSDAFASCPSTMQSCAASDAANAAIQASHQDALAANVAYGVAAAAALVAGVLWFTGAPGADAPRVRVVPSIAPGESGVVVVGRF